MKSDKIILIGAPGSGKGTLSRFLAQKMGIIHVSTGEILRRKIQSDPAFAKKVQHYVEKGDYVPDDITNQVVTEYLKKLPKNQGYILDGYPRTIDQLRYIFENDIEVDHVFYLLVTSESIIERLSKRRFCPTCQTSYHLSFAKPKIKGKCDFDGGDLITRKDDKAEIIRPRITKFVLSIEPIMQYLEKTHGINYVNAEQSPEYLFRTMNKIINKSKKQ